MSADDARHRQQNRRAKLRAEGLVMREVWILPQHGPLLLKVEKLLRMSNSRPLVQALQGVSAAMSTSPVTPQMLYASLQAGELASAGTFSYSLIEGVDPVILANAHDYGDVSIYIAVIGEIIVAQATLFPLKRVRDTAAFNDRVLRTEKLFDLANISIDVHPDGSEYYVIYGALRSTSALPDVEYEISTLAHNAVDAASAYREFLK
jgi:uncharacterized protein YjfI (DUF2170 family)